MPENYPNNEDIRKKASKLKNLVLAVDVVAREDSLLGLAKMDEKTRKIYLEKAIKNIKYNSEKKQREEAARLRDIQAKQLAAQENDPSGNKWYWNNPKTRSEGFDEFKKLWGIRVNEDNWRRSEKTTFAIIEDENDSSKVNSKDTLKVAKDTLTVENLLKNVPLTDSAKANSMNRLLASLYDAGVIYKEQLLENEMAAKQFHLVLDRNYESDFNLLSSYQLYRMYSESDKPKAENQKQYILNMYPNSDYANYLRDPDYFIKKKERDALAEQEYISVLERYNRGLYSPVISKSDMVIADEKDNVYRPKYMLLKALSIGQTTDKKEEIQPILDQIIKEYPKSDEEKRAKELLAILKDGLYVLVFLEKEVSSNAEKTKVSDFNREFFSRSQLKTSSKIYGDNQSVIFVEEFPTDLKALEYIRVFKNTRKHLLDLQKAKIIAISRENLKLLFESRKLEEYEDFMLENY